MNVRRLQGWALIISALINLISLCLFLLDDSVTAFLFRNISLLEIFAHLTIIITLIGGILLLVGLPAIQATQPQTGRLGQIGLVLLGLAALIPSLQTLLLSLNVSVDVGSIIPLLIWLGGLVGSLIVGWVTVQARVFPGWIGWLLIIAGILSFVTGLTRNLSIWDVVILANAVAIAGYGWVIARR